MEASALLETWVRLVTPNVCTQPTPAVTRPRGVEDAAPYGWVRDIRCGMLCKWYVCPAPPKCARAVPAGLHTLGCGRKVDAPWATRVRLVRRNKCV